MLRPGLATQPEALTAIICAAVLLAAPVTLTPYKYAVFLTLITFDSLILCQYSCALPLPCMHEHHDTVQHLSNTAPVEHISALSMPQHA